MRLLGFFLFLVSLAGLYLFVAGFATTGEMSLVGPDKLDLGGSFGRLGTSFPGDILLLMGSLFVLLWGLKWMILGPARGPAKPPPPSDPSDEKAMRKYQVLLSTYKPVPRMPTALLLNSYVILTLIMSLFFGARGSSDPFLLGLLGGVLGLALFFGLIMLFLALKVEKSLGTAGGLVGLLVHVVGLGGVVAAAFLK